MRVAIAKHNEEAKGNKRKEAHFDGRQRVQLPPRQDQRVTAVDPLMVAVQTGTVQGGLLLSKTTQTSRPLEIALDMAIDHTVRHMRRKAGRDR
jgi:hypothetical protein